MRALDRMYNLLVFDLDGTLVDSREDLANATNRLILEHGGQPLDLEAVVAMVGEGVEKLVMRAFAATNLLPVADGATSRFLQLYGERLLVHTRAYPGVAEALAQLHGIVKLAVLTNKPTAMSRQILEGLGLAPFFEQIVGGDGPLPRKPDPAGLLRLIADCGVAPADAMLVGDSRIDLRTARAANVKPVLVRYGFGFSAIDAEELGNKVLTIRMPGELVSIVQDRPE